MHIQYKLTILLSKIPVIFGKESEWISMLVLDPRTNDSNINTSAQTQWWKRWRQQTHKNTLPGNNWWCWVLEIRRWVSNNGFCCCCCGSCWEAVWCCGWICCVDFILLVDTWKSVFWRLRDRGDTCKRRFVPPYIKICEEFWRYF